MQSTIINIGTQYSEVFKEPDAHWVPTEDWSPSKYGPADPSLCTFRGNHSCEGDGSWCGYNSGISRGDFIVCTGPLTETNLNSA